MVENVNDEVAYDRRTCEKDKYDRMLVNRLIKGSCEFPRDIKWSSNINNVEGIYPNMKVNHGNIYDL